MAEKLILAPASREFGLLEYELQLALHATTARITDGYQLSNPHWNVAFEKRAKVGSPKKESVVQHLILGLTLSGKLG